MSTGVRHTTGTHGAVGIRFYLGSEKGVIDGEFSGVRNRLNAGTKVRSVKPHRDSQSSHYGS